MRHKRTALLRKTLLCTFIVLLCIPANLFYVYANDSNEEIEETPPPPIVQLQPDSNWHGTVFGDVGGQDKITSVNFSITEAEDSAITLASLNNRGKISSSTDGIAYLYQAIDENNLDKDFEFTTTAIVHSIDSNNQASFGIMLRHTAYDFIHSTDVAKDDYLAVGALDQAMKGFFRQEGSLNKLNLDPAPSAPAENATYTLGIKRTSGFYTLTINDSSMLVDQYESDVKFIGLFTARNASVTFTNTTLTFASDEAPISELQFYAFGGNTSESKNPQPIATEDGYILEATGGKIASSDEGLSMLAYELPVQTNFKLSTTAVVHTFNENSGISTPNQKSFGLMIRDGIGEQYSSTTTTANYVAVGALDQVMKSFYKQGVVNGTGGSQTKLTAFSDVHAPAASAQYELEIEKNGNSYMLTVNGQSTIIEASLSGDQLFAGIFVARDAKVEFSALKLEVLAATVTRLEVNSDHANLVYRLHEQLDLTGLVVKAHLSDGNVIELDQKDYVVTGFDSSTIGSKTLSIHYRGAIANLDYEVEALHMSALAILYEPIKTQYYIGDSLELQGLTVEANYEDGFLINELDPSEYEILIDNQTYNGYGLDAANNKYIFTASGSYEVTIRPFENQNISISFNVNVAEATLSNLEITKLPNKTTYYLEEWLSLEGLVVYAVYDDGSRVRIPNSELEVSQLDSSSSREATITLTYRGKTAAFVVTVKEKQPAYLNIKQYPQTTYLVGEQLDLSNIQVELIYDSGYKELLLETQYTIDTAAVNVNEAGQYNVLITAQELDIPQVRLPITIREAQDMQWKSIRFGQSTSTANNTIEVDEQGVVTLKAVGGSAGKVTGDHDGISFYYVELDAAADNFELSADIKVIEYAKSPDHDGQESFGIMARDAIGNANDSSVFASNIAAIGGYSGGTRNPNGTQLFVRTGIESPDGSGSEGIKAVMLQAERPSMENTHPNKPYRLKLSKTNSGFIGQINDSEPQLMYTDAIMNVQDDKMYVGFYTARLATIEVHNIELQITAAASDAPRVEAPQTAITPMIDIVSLLETSQTDDYEVRLLANSDGTVTIKQGSEVIVQDEVVNAHSIASYPAALTTGSNRFSIQFIPSDEELLTSYEPIILNRTVTVKQYAGDIFVSPAGTAAGAGTIEDPLDLDTAITYISPGQTIIVLDGHYKRTSKLEIKKYNDGTADAKKTIRAAEGTRPVIDFDKKSEGVVLSGNYWHFIGLDFARSANNTKGFTVGGSHNIIELVHLYEHGDTGLQISRTDQSTHIEDWPSYNLILNSTSYANRDPSNNNADGFAAKLTSGVGNVFRGCIAHHNIDDGWDLYTKAGSGAIGAVIIEDSIAYSNGYQLGGTELMGDGNGFKLGGEGIHVPHVIRNSIAFNNGTVGFTSNSNPGVIAHNNIGFNNGKGNIVFTTYSGITPDFTITEFVSFGTASIPRDQVPISARSNHNYFNDGAGYKNKAGVAITEANFKSLEVPIEFERDENGDIIWGDFLSFIAPKQPSVPSLDPATGPSASPTPTPQYDETNDFIKLSVQGKAQEGAVEATLTEQQVKEIAEAASRLASLTVQISVEAKHGAEEETKNRTEEEVKDRDEEANQVPSNSAIGQYLLTLPTSLLSNSSFKSGNVDISVITPIGGIILSNDILLALYSNEHSSITIQLQQVSNEELAANLNVDGVARPIISFTLHANGKQLEVAGHTILLSIPYDASKEQDKLNRLSIAYIDNSGQIQPIANAYYDPKTGHVVGKTNHLSSYAVVLAEKSFTDVPAKHWASEAISVLAAKGIVNGINDNQFAPSATVTRAQYITMLVRAFGLTAEAGTSTNKGSKLTALATPFHDVSAEHYAAEAIAIGEQLGIVNGYPDSSFRPAAAITRQEMFMMTYRALQHVERLKLQEPSNPDRVNQYVDGKDVASYARTAISALLEAEFVSGNASNKLLPLQNASRAEAAVLIERILASYYK